MPAEIARESHLYTDPVKWEYTRLNVIDLWQVMEYFNAHDFAKCLQEVYAYEKELQRRCEEAGDWNKQVVSGWVDEDTNKLLDRVRGSFPHKEFPHTSSVRTRVYAFANSQCTYQELWMRVVALRETMEDELRARKIVLVPGLKAEYCDKKDAFGEAVAKSFPSAETEIIDAGNCYAFGFNTARVFHLMRVLERGIRALATDLEIPYKNEAWGRIINDIEDAIQLLREPKNQSPKRMNLHFYSEYALEFRYIKDAWRNYVMHAQSTYDERLAKTIIEHVQNVMQRLAERLSD